MKSKLTLGGILVVASMAFLPTHSLGAKDGKTPVIPVLMNSATASSRYLSKSESKNSLIHEDGEGEKPTALPKLGRRISSQHS